MFCPEAKSVAIKSLSGGQVVSTCPVTDGAIAARSGFLKTPWQWWVHPQHPEMTWLRWKRVWSRLRGPCGVFSHMLCRTKRESRRELSKGVPLMVVQANRNSAPLFFFEGRMPLVDHIVSYPCWQILHHCIQSEKTIHNLPGLVFNVWTDWELKNTIHPLALTRLLQYIFNFLIR